MKLEAIEEILKLLYNLEHGWSILMFLGPHPLDEVDDLRVPLFS